MRKVRMSWVSSKIATTGTETNAVGCVNSRTGGAGSKGDAASSRGAGSGPGELAVELVLEGSAGESGIVGKAFRSLRPVVLGIRLAPHGRDFPVPNSVPPPDEVNGCFRPFAPILHFFSAQATKERVTGVTDSAGKGPKIELDPPETSGVGGWHAPERPTGTTPDFESARRPCGQTCPQKK